MMKSAMKSVTTSACLHLAPRHNRTALLGLTGAGFVALAVAFGASQPQAQTAPPKVAVKPAAKPAAAPKAEPTAAAPEIVNSQPVTHARSAAITACLPAISELSRLTLDAPHMALSTWNKTDANERLFSSIIGLKYENTIAPRAITIMTAAPNLHHACDGESVQIQPSSLSCEAIQKNFTTPTLKAQDLNGVTIIQGDGPLRFALLPTSGNGCTVVAVGTYFAK